MSAELEMLILGFGCCSLPAASWVVESGGDCEAAGPLSLPSVFALDCAGAWDPSFARRLLRIFDC